MCIPLKLIYSIYIYFSIFEGVLKFFGHIGCHHPNLLVEKQTQGLTDIMRIASDFNNTCELSIQLIAFETLAFIGSSTEGKCTLQKFSKCYFKFLFYLCTLYNRCKMHKKHFLLGMLPGRGGGPR